MTFEAQLIKTLKSIEPISDEHAALAATRLDNLTKPQKSLGRIEDLAIQLAAITRTERPVLTRAAVMVCAGDHGVVDEGVTSFPQEVTVGMVANFTHQGAAINQLSNTLDVQVEVYDVGVAADTSMFSGIHQCKVALGTENMAKGVAMTRELFCQAVLVGYEQATELLKSGMDMLCLGEMGIGNSSAAATITAAITQTPINRVVGRGAGLSDEQLNHKISVLDDALRINDVANQDIIGIGAAVGGLEIAMMTGIVLACAQNKRPVIADGYISGSAVLLAVALVPQVRDYVVFSHRSVEQGHQAMYEHLDARPLFDLDLRLGEGTGAVLAVPFVRSACAVITGMATFEEAGL